MPTFRIPRQWARSWWAAAAWLVLACGQAPTPCVAADQCGAGLECLANQCRLLGGHPVAEGSERLVLLASRVRLGADATGPAAPQRLYLQFVAPPPGIELRSAFLLLPGANIPNVPHRLLALSIQRAAPHWPDNSTSSDWPTPFGAEAQGLASDGAPMRIDVTPLVQAWLATSAPTQVLRVSAEDRDGVAAWSELRSTTPLAAHLATAQLELYVSPLAGQR